MMTLSLQTMSSNAIRRRDGFMLSAVQSDTTDEWLPTTEAVRYIGKSISTLERLASAKLVRFQLFERPRMRAERRYWKADLERYRGLQRQRGRATRQSLGETQFVLPLQYGAMVIAPPAVL